MRWPEHPEGGFRMVVNNKGLRENEDTQIQKADQAFRILVTGDSHIDGVVAKRPASSRAGWG
jgi:hypothetical protein